MKAKAARLLGVVAAAVFALSCSDAVLNGISEREANKAIGILQDQGLTASKESDNPDARTFKVLVAQRDRGRAVGVLNDFGIPRPAERRFRDINKDSLVMSPLQEKARYLEGLQGEITSVLEATPGIVSSRVLVALPDPDLSGQARSEPKASVIMEYRGDQAPLRPDEVQRTVANAVSDLKPDNVNVVMRPIGLVSSAAPCEFVAFGPIAVARQSLIPLKMLTGLIVLLFAALGASLYWNGRVMNELRYQLQAAQRQARALQKPPKPAA